MDISVAIQTFNHEPFIEKTIKSVLEQTGIEALNVEVVILDDCSNDKTKKICEAFQKDNPNIRIIGNEINLGVNKAYEKLISSCRGKYVAYLDGDDFWIDKEKLINQFNVCELNKLEFCAGKSEIIDNKGNIIGSYDGPKSKKVDRDYFWNGGYLQTSTYFMLRQTLTEKLPLFKNVKFCITDALPRYLLTKNDKIGFYDCYCSAYRVWDDSYWTSKSQLEKDMDFYYFWVEMVRVEKDVPTFKKELLKVTKNIIRSSNAKWSLKLDILIKYLINKFLNKW
jgi:glycosyltransferase involved in cell wall biosynthesis